MNRHRIAFIGGAVDSIIGQSHHAACVLDGRWELVAGSFSRDPDRNLDTGRAWGIPANRCFEDWQELIKKLNSELDAVAVLTPSPSHADIIKACIENGLPVISEKPITTSHADAVAIAALQKTHDAFIAVTFNYNAFPMIRELGARVQDGQMGDLWHMQIEMPQSSMSHIQNFDQNPSLAWRVNDEGGYPSVLTDLGTHAIDMARFCTGELPTEVFMELGNHGPNRTEQADSARLMLRYASGLQGSIWVSTTATGNRHGMNIQLYGSLAGAHWHQESPEELLWNPVQAEKTIVDRGSPDLVVDTSAVERMKPGHVAGFIDAFANLYTDVADCLDNGRIYSPYTSTVAQSVAGLELIEAALKSEQSGKWSEVRYSDYSVVSDEDDIEPT